MDIDHLGNKRRSRLNFLMGGCALLTLFILSRAAALQIFAQPKLERLAKRQFQFQTLVQPRRGAILDRHGHPLAISIQSKSLAANPGKIQNKRAVALQLSALLELPSSTLMRRLSEKKQFVWLKRHLSPTQFKALQKSQLIEVDQKRAPGLWLVQESKRIYPEGKLASHILGTVDIDHRGVEGVELWKEEVLKGQVASVNAIKDALGRPTFMDAEAAEGLKDGQSVVLSLDASLQFEVEHHLRLAMEKTQARSGTAIIMDAETGEILALTNEPSFNPNPAQKNVLDHRRNRAVTDGYEPGSTLKAMLVASALMNDWKMTDSVYAEKGAFVVQGRRISEATAHEKFEWLNLQQMLQVSSNVAAAKIAMKLGPSAYFQTLRAFGFGQRTGSGFPGEISGRFPSKASWEKDYSPLTVANVGFGQGILVTALQMIRAFAVLRNGGWLIQPTFFKIGESGRSVSRQQILPTAMSEALLQALETVTQQAGTGKAAKLEGFMVAGKTGTAQMVDPVTKKYSRKKYIASFIGFPLEVQPSVVIFVSLTEPQGSYYGATIAAPLFKSILASTATRLKLPQKLPANHQDTLYLVQAAPQKGQEDPLLQWIEEDQQKGWRLPSLKGLTIQEILSLTAEKKMIPIFKGSGVVVNQFPESGQLLKPGEKLTLWLSDPS